MAPLCRSRRAWAWFDCSKKRMESARPPVGVAKETARRELTGTTNEDASIARIARTQARERRIGFPPHRMAAPANRTRTPASLARRAPSTGASGYESGAYLEFLSSPESSDEHQPGCPATWTMRAFPRSTRIWAIVFGRVTTSSLFSRYVVSIPAKGGMSSRTWTRTWSFRLGATGARFVSSERTTRIRSGSFDGGAPFGRGDWAGGVSSTACGRGPNASARDFLRRATMFSNNADSWVVR